MYIKSCLALLLASSLTFDAGVDGRAVLRREVSSLDQNSVGGQLARRVVVEPVAPKAPSGPKGPKGPGGTGPGESSNPGGGVDVNSIPGNPNRVSGQSTGETDGGAIPGQPKEDTVPANDEAIPPKEDGQQTEENTNPNCKRGLQGRADCSDVEMTDAERQSSSSEEGQGQRSSSEGDSWPSTDRDSVTSDNEAMMKPYDEVTYRDNGEKSQKYLTGEEPAHAPDWRPYTRNYEDVVKPEYKNTNPVGQQTNRDQAGAAEVFDRFGIKYDASVTDWSRADVKSKTPNQQEVTNQAYYSPSQKTVSIDTFRGDWDGWAPKSPERLPSSELNKQVYGEKSGTEGVGFQYVFQPRVTGKGSIDAIKDLWRARNWRSAEWHSFDFSNLKPNSRAPIDKTSDQTLVSGIDNVRTFEAMAGTYGKTIKSVHIQGINQHTDQPVIVIEFVQ
ncbi:MAG: hypothetical protein Q9174_005359 [Haloplaca sp. 1 TL-2023]